MLRAAVGASCRCGALPVAAGMGSSPLAAGLRLTGVMGSGLGGSVPMLQQQRGATKKAGGSSRNGRDSPGQRLGLKKFGGHAVAPGNIIVRQRGLKFTPGEGVGLGRDYTIFALKPGFVQFEYVAAKKKQLVHVVDVSPHQPLKAQALVEDVPELQEATA